MELLLELLEAVASRFEPLQQCDRWHLRDQMMQRQDVWNNSDVKGKQKEDENMHLSC